MAHHLSTKASDHVAWDSSPYFKPLIRQWSHTRAIVCKNCKLFWNSFFSCSEAQQALIAAATKCTKQTTNTKQSVVALRKTDLSRLRGSRGSRFMAAATPAKRFQADRVKAAWAARGPPRDPRAKRPERRYLVRGLEDPAFAAQGPSRADDSRRADNRILWSLVR